MLFLIICLITCGCAAPGKKLPSLEHGFTRENVTQLWGNPTQKSTVGRTRDNYSVEVWEYYKKKSLSKKEETYILIFVDGELYSWAVNNPAFAFKELAKLGVLRFDPLTFEAQQNQLRLQSITEQAQQTRKTMEIIRTYQDINNTRLQLLDQQQRRILHQQLLFPPPKFQQPIKPQRR